MKKLTYVEGLGVTTQEVLDWFTAQAHELGLGGEQDVVSVQVFDANTEYVVAMKEGRRPAPRVRVGIVYWKT